MATAQAFVRSISLLPDPTQIPPEDAVETLIGLIAGANEVDFGPQKDRYFVADVPGAGLVLGKNPQVIDGKLILEIHVPGGPGGGPPLGPVASAENPGTTRGRP